MLEAPPDHQDTGLFKVTYIGHHESGPCKMPCLDVSNSSAGSNQHSTQKDSKTESASPTIQAGENSSKGRISSRASSRNRTSTSKFVSAKSQVAPFLSSRAGEPKISYHSNLFEGGPPNATWLPRATTRRLEAPSSNSAHLHPSAPWPYLNHGVAQEPNPQILKKTSPTA